MVLQRSFSWGSNYLKKNRRKQKGGFLVCQLARSQVSPSKDTQRYFSSKYYRALSVKAYWLKRAPTLLISELLSLRIVQINASYIAPFSHASPRKLLLPSLPCQSLWPQPVPRHWLLAVFLSAGPAQSIVHQQLLSQGAKNTTLRQLHNHFPCLFLPIPLSLFALPMEKGKLNYSQMSS